MRERDGSGQRPETGEGSLEVQVEGHFAIDPKLLEILVCPLTKAPLRYDQAAQELISDEAGLAYPIRDGIPIMLVDEARRLGDEEKAKP
jgi:uncharacterized protein YbaR (Trm112 family)